MPSPGRDVGEGEPGWDSRRAGGQEPGAHPSYRRGPASSAELLLSWLASWRLCAMLGRDFLAPCSAGRAHLPPPPPRPGFTVGSCVAGTGVCKGRTRPAEVLGLRSSPAHVRRDDGQSWCKAIQLRDLVRSWLP